MFEKFKNLFEDRSRVYIVVYQREDDPTGRVEPRAVFTSLEDAKVEAKRLQLSGPEDSDIIRIQVWQNNRQLSDLAWNAKLRYFM